MVIERLYAPFFFFSVGILNQRWGGEGSVAFRGIGQWRFSGLVLGDIVFFLSF